MKVLLHLLRAALAGALVMLTLYGLMLADPSHADTNVGLFLVAGVFCGLAAAVLLLLFRVGPVMKVVLGLFCGPALPVLVLAPRLVAEGKHQVLGGLVVLWAVIGLLVGALDASRVIRMRREVETV